MSICTRSVIAASLVVVSGILSPLTVWSTEPAKTEATNDVQQKCNDGTQDRAACLREVGAAAQERRSGGLTDPVQKQQQRQNATARCDDQPATARAACEARMGGATDSKSEGSVTGGGIIRETVTPSSVPR